MIPTIKIDDNEWDRREHDWTGKSFYTIRILSLFNNPIGLAGKLEQLNQDLRSAGYKMQTNMVLIQPGMFSTTAMIEVDTQSKFDANILYFEEQTTADTAIYKGSPGKVSSGMNRLTEFVASKRGMEPRRVMYMFAFKGSDSDYKTILFAVT